HLVFTRILLDRGDLLRRLGVGDRLGLGGFRFLDAHVLVVALLVVALLLGNVVVGLRARNHGVLTRLVGVLVLSLGVGLGLLLHGLGFGDADVLRVAGHAVALRLGGLVFGGSPVLRCAIFACRHSGSE